MSDSENKDKEVKFVSAEESGMSFDPYSVKLSIKVIIPGEYLKSMPYDTFLAYTDNVAREVNRQLKDAAVDEWFKKQPLYNGEDNANRPES